jgi:PhoH-like ATPase
VDEAQSLERNVLLTVLSCLGTASRVVLTTTSRSGTT